MLLYILLTGTSPFERPEDAALSRVARVKVMLLRIAACDYCLPPGLSSPAIDLLRGMLNPGGS